MRLCEVLAGFVHDLEFSHLPARVISRGKWAILDYLAACFAGARYGEMSPIIQNYVAGFSGRQQCSVIGLPRKMPAALAALANGVISHTVELDDGHRFGTSHPAAAVIPAAIVMAERLGRSGADLLLSTIAGYEVMLRIATAINPSHLHRGFHTTGTCGALGAAAAAAKLARLTRQQTIYAISMAALQGAGLQEMLYSNPMIKPLQSGKAAMAGVFSAELAGSGARAPASVFEGDLGFFRAMADSVHEQDVTEGLGTSFEIERTYFKFYPLCRHAHCAMDLLRQMLDCHRPLPDEVDYVRVRTYSVAAREVGKIVMPRCRDEAMFSVPYAVAVWLHEGRLTPAELGEPYLSRSDIRGTAERVSVERDERLDAEYPAKRGATVMVRLKDGRCLEESCDLPYGEPETMDDDNMLLKKFHTYADGGLSDEDTSRLVEYVRSIEQQKDTRFLARCIRNIPIKAGGCRKEQVLW